MAKAKTGKTCVNVAPYKGSDKAGNLVLSGYSCCEDSLAVLVNGLKGTKTPAKTHLKPLADALTKNANALQEYSVLIWGLKERDRAKLFGVLKEQFDLTVF